MKHSEETKKKMSLTHKGLRHTEESKKKMSLARKGFRHTEESKKKMREVWTPKRHKAYSERMKGKKYRLGYKDSEETRKKASERMKGNKLLLGHKHSEETRKKLSLAGMGKKHTEETKRKISLSHKGNKCYCWKGGVTLLNVKIRQSVEGINWKNSIFKRDNYTCQKCGDKKGGNFEAHHKFGFGKILQMFLKKYNQFSPIEDKETLVRLAIKYKPFWNLDNGETLCVDCHKRLRIRDKNLKLKQNKKEIENENIRIKK